MSCLPRFIGKTVAYIGNTLILPFNNSTKILARTYAAQKLTIPIIVKTRHGELQMSCTSKAAARRAINYLRAEPETLDWIDALMLPGECLWDIGANVGVYSLYAALRGDLHVLAFEPSAQTFATLMKNIEINRLDSKVQAYCIAFSDQTGVLSLNLSNTDAGTSRHRLGKVTTRPIVKTSFVQPTISYTIDAFLRDFDVRKPDHIKIDVDGVESHILFGAKETLKSVKSILVEINQDSEDERIIVPFLKEAGFKCQDMDTPSTRNKIFIRVST